MENSHSAWTDFRGAGQAVGTSGEKGDDQMHFVVRPLTYSLAAIVLALSSAAAKGQPVLWSVEEGGNGHYYEVITGEGRVTWQDARAIARSMKFLGMQGHLATLTSAKEILFLIEYSPPLLPESDQIWLGGYQLPGNAPNEGWAWVTGEPWDYANWGAGEPNDRPATEDALQTNNEGTWNDLPSNSSIPAFIVEYDGLIDLGGGPPGSLRYAALGDSYSAGEGTFDYIYFTEADPSPLCHRSRLSYPWLLQRPDLAGGPGESFVACSGAKIENVEFEGTPQTEAGLAPLLDEPGTQSAQIDPGPWDLVTITVGGNDVGFVWFLARCLVLPDCSRDLELDYLRQLPGLLERVPVFGSLLDDNTPPETYWERQIDSKLTQLTAVYDELVAKTRGMDPSRVYVLGYPHLFPDVVRPECFLADSPRSPPFIPPLIRRERAFLNSGADRLNCVIAEAAARAQVNFVPVRRWFEGHEVCAPGGASTEWLNGLFPQAGLSFDIPTLDVDFDFGLNIRESFHPNPLGYKFGYARALDAHMAGFSPLPEDCSGLAAQATRLGVAGDNPSLEFGELGVSPVDSGCAGEVFVREQAVQLTGRGFLAGSTVVLFLRSVGGAPTELGETTADDSGQVELTIAVPSTAPVGEYVMFEAAGESPNGNGLLLDESVAIASSDVADVDEDGVPDVCDNCLNTGNAEQVDSDFDGIGDNCDACPDDARNDWDEDGLCGAEDPCEFDTANDSDGDGVCESTDNCPTVSNADQVDSDSDGRGDACTEIACYRVSLEVKPVELGAVGVTPPNCLASMYEEGTVLEASAAPVGDNEFIRWEEASQSLDESISLVVDGDIILRAVFATPIRCAGDCDSDGNVTINELIRGVNIALGRADSIACSSFDADRDGTVTVAELVRAVNAALRGCPP